MALCNSKSSTHFQFQQSQPILFLSFTIFFFLLFPFATSVSFNFTRFHTNDPWINYQGDAFASNKVIQLTKNLQDTSLSFSVGRAAYVHPVHVWDSETRKLTDFNTHFSFIIKAVNLSAASGDGLAFFLSPFNAGIPINSTGGFLGLFENSTGLNYTDDQMVAVEFDTYPNSWDPNSEHVGIDVNSIVSVAYATWNTSMKNGSTGNAWVNYNSTTTTLSVYLTHAANPTFQGNYGLSCVVDLRKVLPEWVNVGFSAATGLGTETHNIISWTFNSTLGGSYNSTSGGSPSTGKGHRTTPVLLVGLAGSIGAFGCGVGFIRFRKWKKTVVRGKNDMGLDTSIDDDSFEKGAGPRRFTFRKASKESDVYSFGVVALEIACGRKPVVHRGDLDQVRLSEWVWSLYGEGKLFEAVDKDLTMEYDEGQVERLMVVGLWCCHPDLSLRPSIRQAINVLTFEAPLPVLPAQMPVPVYFSPPLSMFSYTSSFVTTDSSKDRTQCQYSSHNPNHRSSLSAESSKAQLQLDEDNS
ncbi:hypothetical protein Vadar_004740 [Vaccinium darrowii]|uniref:Uncharacterized protein n=1 Tax=Vaccinium darrowii TaxID=229202 RepID=A0ACB7YCT4_9ERIC|nr:hypothetical protein Vadar_004740 [Vaccinium darrowii]